MGLETGTYINSLNASNPTATDPKSQGDDHLRLIKATLLNTLPQLTGPVNANQAEMNRLVGLGSAAVGVSDVQALTNKNLVNVLLTDGYTEEVFAVSGTTPVLSPNNGSIQTWTLTGNSTPTQGTWVEGQSMTLMIDDGTAFTINWTSIPVTWKTNAGTAPALQATGFTAIVLWKVGTVVYGARVGDA